MNLLLAEESFAERTRSPLAGCLPPDVEKTSNVSGSSVVNVGTGAHLALAADLAETEVVVQLPLKGAVLGVAKVLSEDLSFHLRGVVDDDTASIPLNEVVVGRIGEHARQVEKEFCDGAVA